MNGLRNFNRANARVVLAALITSLALCSATEVRALDTGVPGLVYRASHKLLLRIGDRADDVG